MKMKVSTAAIMVIEFPEFANPFFQHTLNRVNELIKLNRSNTVRSNPGGISWCCRVYGGQSSSVSDQYAWYGSAEPG